MDEQRRFSSAHALALIALFVALGGTALAALERNSVKSKQIKDEAILSKDIRDGQVLGGDVDESTLDVDESTLDESKLDVVESTLSTVPDAAALGGIAPSGYERAVNWAVVGGSTTGATVVRGTATGAARVTPGQYSVSFPPDISACAYVATSGDTAMGTGPPGEISVEGASAGGLDPTTTVEVRHYNSAGTLADYGDGLADGFHIAVIC